MVSTLALMMSLLGLTKDPQYFIPAGMLASAAFLLWFNYRTCRKDINS
jgi:hypothetical protein